MRQETKWVHWGGLPITGYHRKEWPIFAIATPILPKDLIVMRRVVFSEYVARRRASARHHQKRAVK